MPVPPPQPIKRGDPITAEWLNRTRRVGKQAVGSFQSSAHNVSVSSPRSNSTGRGGIRIVKVDEDIAGATNDGLDETTEPEYELTERVYNSEGKRVDGGTVTVRNAIPDSVTVPVGKWRVGICEADANNSSRIILVQVSCQLFDIVETST